MPSGMNRQALSPLRTLAAISFPHPIEARHRKRYTPASAPRRVTEPQPPAAFKVSPRSQQATAAAPL